jgi:ribosomal protein S18 acetylase RimI-like enzyme
VGRDRRLSWYRRPVIVTSLGYRTDLALRQLEGSEITEHDDCLVVRSPANPAFRWGNFLLLRQPPRPGEIPGWIARFQREFPDADYTALGLDVTEADGADATELAAAGLSRDLNSVLTATAACPPPNVNRDANYRPLASDQDWRDATALALECNPGPPVEQDFLHRRTATRQRLAADGHGAWFGAFLDRRLVAHLGIFAAADGVARFQDVETHPDARRQGLAGTLVYSAAAYALDNLAARTLVLVADPAGPAIGLYRSLGFADREYQVGLERLTPDVQ